MVEHDIGFIGKVADVISGTHQGRLLIEGVASEIEADPMVREAYLGWTGITGA